MAFFLLPPPKRALIVGALHSMTTPWFSPPSILRYGLPVERSVTTLRAPRCRSASASGISAWSCSI
eukprot:1121800-Prymnesium_polylepis.1